jgi:hypothetical protein
MDLGGKISGGASILDSKPEEKCLKILEAEMKEGIEKRKCKKQRLRRNILEKIEILCKFQMKRHS